MFKPVPHIPDFPAIENRILEFWRSEGTFQKVRARNADKPPWSFLDGPITANNPMGVHHAWGRSYKDIFQRYHAMCGRELRYQNGFDCQGLWVEVEVEKELGFADKRDIVEYGIDRFVNRCKERVLTFAARQTEQSVRLGYWMDWDDPDTLRKLAAALREGQESVEITAASGASVSGTPAEVIGKLGGPGMGGSYFTFSTENNYTIWRFLKKCHDEGFIYRGTDIMPWCCRCGTGLSQMEVAEGRKITKHTSVFVRFPIRGREKEALLVWTTTPWTLTSNVAAAVNPDNTYLKLRHGDWILYVGKGNYANARVQNLEAGGQKESFKLQTLKSTLKGSAPVEILGELKGAELVGLTYDGPFDHLEAQRRPGGLTPYPAAEGAPTVSSVDAHRVVAWTEVSEGEGTGVVHIAPGCGAEDGRLGRELGLPAIAPLDESGSYLEGFGEWSGRDVQGVAEDITDDLKARDLLVARESYPHVYPHCWRCKQELVFRLVDEWFIRMDWRDRIQKVVPDIRWIPSDGEAREQDWLKNMGDWMISKKRFWGLALPIWVCTECDNFEVLGGPEELEQRAVVGWEDFAGNTPHRPWIDEVEIACSACGARSRRVEDVGNPWLDAGIVPFSTLHYNTDPDYWARWFPANFVVECFPGQFRNWFYALLAMSAMMSGRAPFQVLLGHALVRDERGHEMHKSAGNSIAFDEAAEALGAEVMRYLYASQNPVQNLNFPDLPDEGEVKRTGLAAEVRRKLLTWWNCYSFFVTYAAADGWAPSAGDDAALTEMDRWILSRLQSLTGDAHRAYADFALYRFVASFERFMDDLSNWWLRRSRARFWGEASPDKAAAYHTLYTVLTTVNRLMAPVMPFMTEHIHQNLVRGHDDSAPESVHLLDFPQVDEAQRDEGLEDRIAVVLKVKNLGLKLRNLARIGVRQPLAALTVQPASEGERAVLEDPAYAGQVLEECNFKELVLIEDAGALVKRSIKPNFKALGARYGKQMKAIAAAVGKADAGALLGATQLTLDDGAAIALEPGDLLVQVEAPDHLQHGEEGGTFAALDTRISPALKREGAARDFNRKVQDERKAQDLDISARIHVQYATDADALAEALEEHRGYLMEALLALKFSRVEALEGEGIQSAKIGGDVVHFRVTLAG
jgi:isoleucyl-tRNA synthetase